MLDRFEGWLARCRVKGCGLWRPVNVCPRGADWMTRSWANCSWEGATMLNPGGALFRRDIPGVFAANWLTGSLSLPSGPSPFADCCCSLASMMRRCCSLTFKLCCKCSFITGSWVTKPGDKHAIPTSWIPSPSLPSAGRAVAAPDPVRGFLELDRSSFRGR